MIKNKNKNHIKSEADEYGIACVEYDKNYTDRSKNLFMNTFEISEMVTRETR